MLQSSIIRTILLYFWCILGSDGAKIDPEFANTVRGGGFLLAGQNLPPADSPVSVPDVPEDEQVSYTKTEQKVSPSTNFVNFSLTPVNGSDFETWNEHFNIYSQFQIGRSSKNLDPKNGDSQPNILNVRYFPRFNNDSGESYPKFHFPVKRDAHITVEEEMGILAQGQTMIGTCGGTYTELSDLFASPDFPHYYPAHAHCVYDIEVPPEYKIKVQCPKVDIQPSHENDCGSDYLEIDGYQLESFEENRDGYHEEREVHDEDPLRFCPLESLNVISNTNALKIVFHSDSIYGYSGFICRYTAIYPNGTDAPQAHPTYEPPPDDNCKPQNGWNEWSGKCGIPLREPESRVHGNESKKHGHPWDVAVVKVCFGDEYCYLCTGSIINPTFILTAAHCVYQVKAKDLAVIAGTHDLFIVEIHRVFHRVLERFVHPRFGVPSIMDFNVALLKLYFTMEFNEYMSPICLPPLNEDTLVSLLPEPELDWVKYFGLKQSDMDYMESLNITFYDEAYTSPIHYKLVSKLAIIAAWGWTNKYPGGPPPTYDKKVLHEAYVIVLPNGMCQFFYVRMTKVHLCTYGAYGAGPCPGDSGTPVIMMMKNGQYGQIAIHIMGPLGCASGYPFVSIMIFHVMKWITFITQFDYSQYYIH